MKKTYPSYTANRINPITDRVFSSLSKKNQTAILKFLEMCSVKSKSKKREFGRKTALIKSFDFLEKDFDKITYDNYLKLAKAISESSLGVYSKNMDRDTIKRFLRDNYSDWRERFKELKLLSSEVQSEDKKLTSNDLITEKELDKLIKSTTNLMHKTIIICLYETASRLEELLKTKWSDIDFKKNLIYLYSSKTKKKRVVPVKDCIPHLKRLQEELETKEDDFIFNSRGDKLTNSGLNYILKTLSKKAGIKKYISGYTFRHTRLSFLITKLTPKVYEDIAGHSLQMGLKTYAHLSQDKIIQEMNEKVFEIKELSPKEKEKIKVLEKDMDKLKSENGEIKEAFKLLLGKVKEFNDNILNNKETPKIKVYRR